MDTKSLIIHLIREDMRFNQYMAALRKLGIEVYGFDLDLMSLIGNILEIDKKVYDNWMELYDTELSKSESLPIEPLGKNLYPLAQKCYEALKAFDFSNDCT